MVLFGMDFRCRSEARCFGSLNGSCRRHDGLHDRGSIYSTRDLMLGGWEGCSLKREAGKESEGDHKPRISHTNIRVCGVCLRPEPCSSAL